MREMILVLGGARSGKTRRALDLARQEAATGRSVVYVASCPPRLDAEMQTRIAHHVAERPAAWLTVENEYDLGLVAQAHPQAVRLLDCLTLWLFVQQERLASEAEILRCLEKGLEANRGLGSWIIVSNEIGLGLVPESAASRAFRDLQGRANQLVAAMAEQVEFVAAGLPLRLK